jgi:hypothetical protein
MATHSYLEIGGRVVEVGRVTECFRRPIADG